MNKYQMNQIKELTKIQLEDPTENKYTILAHTNEELGEVSTAMCVEDSSRLKKNKKLDEPAWRESIDLIICGMSLFYVNGGKNEDFDEVVNEKLSKWERSFVSENVGVFGPQGICGPQGEINIETESNGVSGPQGVQGIENKKEVKNGKSIFGKIKSVFTGLFSRG